MAMNVEAEIRDLKRRVGELEGSFGFLTQQLKAVHKDLLAFEEKAEQRFKAVDERFKKVDERFDQVDRRFDHLDRKFDGLAKTLPRIVGDAVREANRERGKKR